jgi:hypothetical protein
MRLTRPSYTIGSQTTRNANAIDRDPNAMSDRTKSATAIPVVPVTSNPFTKRDVTGCTRRLLEDFVDDGDLHGEI